MGTAHARTTCPCPAPVLICPTGFPTHSRCFAAPLSQFLGFDACAHMAEETQHSDINAPRGMVGSAVATAVGGYGYLAALVFCTTDPAVLLDPGNETKGEHAMAQLVWNVHK